ncbi:putative F-box/FBD/LRR-repeat protein At5g22610 [Spinacia oleracea]|uniref:F-box/FBD/LRR-repeat protein At5g22610 n=1 Tax=Spinacia oleracea TaxID=3562 RepID=A0A9R0I018_SPIOL|nr:putative F-box/FBD/LRR-repeat protein At5g22610 [Spinacia oleracea]
MSNDRISRLPEHIIHHILSSIPVKDAGRTSILSKDWKTVCTSYNILPSLHYDHNSFASELLLSGQEPEIFEIRDKFMDFADNNLVRINHENSPVARLILDVVVIRDEFSRVDQLMDIVGKTKVDELCISVQTKDSRWYSHLYDDMSEEEDEEDEYICYEFPYTSVLASKQLQSLSITWCKFMCNKRTLTINENNVNVGVFSSLKQLCLSRVMLNNEALSNVGSCCPWIEFVRFEFCIFLFESLKLSKFPNLKKASIESEEFRRLHNVDCIGTKLESFHCQSDYLKWVINQDACSNIRKLQLGYLSVNNPSLFEDLSINYFSIDGESRNYRYQRCKYD